MYVWVKLESKTQKSSKTDFTQGFNDLFDMNLLVVENDQTKTINEHS